MNTDVDVIIIAGQRPVGAFLSIRLLFEQQEQRFSRFRPDSLLSRMNDGERISDPFMDRAIELALLAHEETRGRFNPCILPTLEAAGYDRSFEDLPEATTELAAIAVPDPRHAIERSAGGIQLRDARIDLGGIVKGWTVDLAIEQLLAEHPDALVNAGGDLRVTGSDGDGPGWALAIATPGWVAPEIPFRWQGAVATSTTQKRRWQSKAGITHHHLIDPATGLPSASGVALVTVLAQETWRAETWAKAILIAGTGELSDAATARGMRTFIARHPGLEPTTEFFGEWPGVRPT